MGTDVVDAEVVNEGTTGRELVHSPGSGVLMPQEAGQVIEGMRAYQRLLHDLLDEGDWQQTKERDAQGHLKRFPKKSAWRKIARAFSLSTEIVPGSRRIERAADGSPLSAECVVRVTAPNGQTGDGDGYCSLTEFKGKRRDDPKLENTMRATATTRAKNRAIADLVGMGEVSAEELAAGGEGDPAAGGTGAGAWYGEPSADETVTKVGQALALLLDSGDGPDEQAAAIVLSTIAKDADAESPVVPRAAARALLFAAAELKKLVAEQEGDGDRPVEEGGISANDDDEPPPEAEVVDGQVAPAPEEEVPPTAPAAAGVDAEPAEDFGLPSREEAEAMRDEARESAAPAPRQEDPEA
jgi:hypothetical protein